MASTVPACVVVRTAGRVTSSPASVTARPGSRVSSASTAVRQVRSSVYCTRHEQRTFAGHSCARCI